MEATQPTVAQEAPEIKSFQIGLPIDLWADTKAEATREQRPAQELVADALRQYLNTKRESR